MSRGNLSPHSMKATTGKGIESLSGMMQSSSLANLRRTSVGLENSRWKYTNFSGVSTLHLNISIMSAKRRTCKISEESGWYGFRRPRVNPKQELGQGLFNIWGEFVSISLKECDFYQVPN